ncbi:MAG: ABC transporter ATP-binding protein [Acidimicrobiia bacterium]
MSSVDTDLGRQAGNAHGAPVLEVSGLTVEARASGAPLRLVEDVSLTVRAGQTLGLVGESGSGKTMTAMAILGLLPRGITVTSGHAAYGRSDLLSLSTKELNALRGREIGVIFQEPRRSLNPAFTVGEQIAEVVRRHSDATRRQAWQRAVELLGMVGIPQPARRARDYPHAFSGGMCQRLMIAASVACEPRLLLADEPTTSLDVTVQAQVLSLLVNLQEQFDLGILFITHDLGVVAEVCHSVSVMYAGQVVEHASVEDIFLHPQHPYTEGLLGAIPSIEEPDARLVAIEGTVPTYADLPSGCRFHPRCRYMLEGPCTDAPPPLSDLGGERQCRCVRVTSLSLKGIDD